MNQLMKKIKITENEIRCFSVVQDKKDKRFGQVCGRLLLKRNSDKKCAGQIKCLRCGALYDLSDEKQTLINI